MSDWTKLSDKLPPAAETLLVKRRSDIGNPIDYPVRFYKYEWAWRSFNVAWIADASDEWKMEEDNARKQNRGPDKPER